ncbi:MAG: hypothetical protein K2N64_05875 [Anaeroplasmataceae bacterium]|nr:hypothetical protein [Anaeroplasmataceae bacterium]
MEKNMVDVQLKEGNTIELPNRIINHLKVKTGETIRILLTEDAVILMSVPVFGEKLLKKL